MLKIELIRFEAQDVITTSTAAPAAPACEHKRYTLTPPNSVTCDDCGATGAFKNGNIFVGSPEWN